MIDVDANSDYGSVFGEFLAEHASAVTRRTTVVVLGDGRNNANDPNLAAFEEITRRARETIWLTPEPRYSWGLGSCDLPAYAEFCNRVRVVRDLTGLEQAALRVRGRGGRQMSAQATLRDRVGMRCAGRRVDAEVLSGSQSGEPGAQWARRTLWRNWTPCDRVPGAGTGASTRCGAARPRSRRAAAEVPRPEIVFGIDSMVEAAHAALRLGALRPMLVTDPGLIEAGWADEMLGHLESAGRRRAGCGAR